MRKKGVNGKSNFFFNKKRKIILIVVSLIVLFVLGVFVLSIFQKDLVVKQYDKLKGFLSESSIFPYSTGEIHPDAEHVLIVVNGNVPESVELGEFYAAKRGVPPENILHITTTDKEHIYFDSVSDYTGISFYGSIDDKEIFNYRDSIETPVKQKIVELTNSGKDIYYVLTTYGVPPYMVIPYAWRGYLSECSSGSGFIRSIDSYLGSPFATYGNTLHLSRPDTKHPYYAGACEDGTGSVIYPCNSIQHYDKNFDDYISPVGFDSANSKFLVTRLDVSKISAMNQMGRTLYAEKYFDNTELGGAYFTGYFYSHEFPCEQVHTPRGYECIGTASVLFDYPSETHSLRTFSSERNGNEYDNIFDIAPGAVIAKLQSSSAASTLRSPLYHAPSIILAGATATYGSASEPCVPGVPRMDKFWDAFLQHNQVDGSKGNYNFAEAVYYSDPYYRWQTIILGDPLFTLPVTSLVDYEVPVISDIEILQVDDTSVKISFLTEISVDDSPEVTRALINYGLTESYGQVKEDSFYFESLDSYAYPYNSYHDVIIDGLLPGEQYHFQIEAVDPAGNVQTSSDFTLGCVDADADGYFAEADCGSDLDCDDSIETGSDVYPGAVELCDGLDNQCVGDLGFGEVDEGCGCTILDMYWDKNEAIEGEEVNFIIEGSNCIGCSFTSYILEDDLFPLSFAGSFSGEIQENIFSQPWIARYDEDFLQDPNYYFRSIFIGCPIGSFVNDLSNNYPNGFLHVNKVPVCNNGVKDVGETCDTEIKECLTFWGYDGNQDCNSACDGWLECVSEDFCGDSVANGPEVCDFEIRGCITVEGYDGNQDCNSACDGWLECVSEDFCGDNIAKGPELCDGEDFRGKSCENLGYPVGQLTCLPDCSLFSTDSCGCVLTDAYWSESSVIEGIEVTLTIKGDNCEGEEIGFEIKEDDWLGDDSPDVNPESVVFSEGFATSVWAAEYHEDVSGNPEYYFVGSLVSDVDNKINSNLLEVSELEIISVVCGDDVKEGEEECEGVEFGEASCVTYGFDSGSLSCSEICEIDVSGCSMGAVNPPNDGGGGGGGGGGSMGYWKTTKTLNEQEVIVGVEKELEIKERVKMDISNEEHSVGIITLTERAMIINISSKPRQAILLIGQEKKFDVNEDNYYDIYVKLNSIEDGKANVTIKKIYEKIPVVQEFVDDEPEEIVEVPKDDERFDLLDFLKSYWYVEVGLIVLIIILILIMKKSGFKREISKIREKRRKLKS